MCYGDHVRLNITIFLNKLHTRSILQRPPVAVYRLRSSVLTKMAAVRAADDQWASSAGSHVSPATRCRVTGCAAAQPWERGAESAPCRNAKVTGSGVFKGGSAR